MDESLLNEAALVNKSERQQYYPENVANRLLNNAPIYDTDNASDFDLESNHSMIFPPERQADYRKVLTALFTKFDYPPNINEAEKFAMASEHATIDSKDCLEVINAVSRVGWEIEGYTVNVYKTEDGKPVIFSSVSYVEDDTDPQYHLKKLYILTSRDPSYWSDERLEQITKRLDDLNANNHSLLPNELVDKIQSQLIKRSLSQHGVDYSRGSKQHHEIPEIADNILSPQEKRGIFERTVDEMIDTIAENAPTADSYEDIAEARRLRPDCTIFISTKQPELYKKVLYKAYLKQFSQYAIVPRYFLESAAEREAEYTLNHEYAHFQGGQEVGWEHSVFALTIHKTNDGELCISPFISFEPPIQDIYTSLKWAYISSRPNPSDLSFTDIKNTTDYLKSYKDVVRTLSTRDPYSSKAAELHSKIASQLFKRLIYDLGRKIKLKSNEQAVIKHKT